MNKFHVQSPSQLHLFKFPIIYHSLHFNHIQLANFLALNSITGWWQYDGRTCHDIEDAYKNGEKHCTILVAGYVYIVDFEQMLQQRQNDPSRKRQVKRDLASVPKKGVAGLRFNNVTTEDVDLTQDSASTSCDTIDTNDAVANTAATNRSNIIDSTLSHSDEHRRNGQSLSNGSSSGHRELRNSLGNDALVLTDDIGIQFESTLEDFRDLSLGVTSNDSESDVVDTEAQDGTIRHRRRHQESSIISLDTDDSTI